MFNKFGIPGSGLFLFLASKGQTQDSILNKTVQYLIFQNFNGSGLGFHCDDIVVNKSFLPLRVCSSLPLLWHVYECITPRESRLASVPPIINKLRYQIADKFSELNAACKDESNFLPVANFPKSLKQNVARCQLFNWWYISERPVRISMRNSLSVRPLCIVIIRWPLDCL